MCNKKIKRYFMALLLVLLFDFVWLFFVIKDFYEYHLSEILRTDSIILVSAIAAWTLIPLGIVLFVDEVSKNRRQALFYGSLYGLILYGVYEFTNHATLSGWSIEFVFVDILWGVFLCATTSWLLKIIFNKKSS